MITDYNTFKLTERLHSKLVSEYINIQYTIGIADKDKFYKSIGCDGTEPHDYIQDVLNHMDMSKRVNPIDGFYIKYIDAD